MSSELEQDDARVVDAASRDAKNSSRADSELLPSADADESVSRRDEAPRESSEAQRLEELVAERSFDRPPAIRGGTIALPLMAECLEDTHPTLQGRVKVEYEFDGRLTERWVPTLMHIVIRTGDRVLLQQAENWPEPIVVGVVDGFTPRPEQQRGTAASLELRQDEKMTVAARDGQPLVEVWQGESGPVVRVLHKDTDVRFSGKLALRAESIEIEAEKGKVEVRAQDDVDIKGEIIHLN
ncbi:MAG: hypothetical protein AAGF12_02925 [Myxococcota bacterium]